MGLTVEEGLEMTLFFSGQADSIQADTSKATTDVLSKPPGFLVGSKGLNPQMDRGGADHAV